MQFTQSRKGIRAEVAVSLFFVFSAWVILRLCVKYISCHEYFRCWQFERIQHLPCEYIHSKSWSRQRFLSGWKINFVWWFPAAPGLGVKEPIKTPKLNRHAILPTETTAHVTISTNRIHSWQSNREWQLVPHDLFASNPPRISGHIECLQHLSNYGGYYLPAIDKAMKVRPSAPAEQFPPAGQRFITRIMQREATASYR